MSDLNPLKFQVAIQDDATKQLSNIEAALNSLKDRTISVKVEGLNDLQQLLSALQHVQVQNIGKDVGSAINEATKNLQKEAQDAIRKSLGELAANLVAVKEAIQHDNFSAFSKRIDACATSMNTLNEAFGKFKITIGSDEGMKNFMTGLGEVIRNVRNTMGMLNGSSTASVTPDAMSRSVKVARHETERLNNDLVRAQRTIETFGDKGFNVSALERYKKEALIIRENLEAIRKSGGVHPLTGLTASQYLTSEDASRVVSLLKTELSYYKNIGNELERIGKIRSTLTSILSTNPTTAYRGDINNALAGLDLREGLLARQDARDAMQTLNSEAYNQQIKEAISLISKVSSESRQSAKDNAHLIESMRKAGVAVSDMASKFDRLEIAKIRANAVDARVDTSAYDKAVERMERYRRVLEYIAKNGGHDADRITKSVGYRNASNDLNVQAAALKALTKEANSASSATQQLSAEQQRLAQALETSTNKLHGQSQVLSDLKSLATQYLGVWGAQSYLHKIIETGGQLEQQRLSLSAILGDVEKANTLFGQVKELAVRSPFGVVQIDQMTKQLAAYSFEYEELFDWTKRLADISAATGTDVSRLALALGHVRSEGALSGYTLKQFAMANVPVLRMLSENLGISTKEVRERVKKKEISADDVQEILKQLTDEGGMFYNAQETMSEALNAKYKNLRDAFDIMYGEIAEGGVGEALKEIAIILTQGAKEWERFGKDILMVAAAFGIGKAAIALYNTALGEGTAATLRSIAAAQQKENANLRLARSAGLVTKAEYEQLISNERYSVSALKVALTTNKLTIEELQRAVALGKVNKTVAQAAVVAAGYDAALISNVRVLGMWRKGIFLLSEGFRYAIVAVKSFLASVWPLLALSAVFDLVNRTSSNNDAAKEAAEGAAKATNKYQDLQAMTDRLGNSQGKTNDQLENNVKAMKEALVAVGEYTDKLKKQVDSVDSLAEKYNILHEAMKKVSEQASDRQSRKQALIEGGLSSGGGTAWNPLNWFRDNALRDAKDIDDYTKDLYLALDKNDKVLREGFRKILKTRGEWQEKFATMSAKDIFMSLDEYGQNSLLSDAYKNERFNTVLKRAVGEVRNIMYGSETGRIGNAYGYSYQGAFNELRGHKDELAKAFEDAFRVDYPDIDLSKADEGQKIIFAKWLDTTIANLADVKEAGKKALNDIVIEGTITVRPKYSLDNENFVDFMNTFREKNPLAYFEWQQHGRDKSATEEEQRKSAESYGRTFSGATQSNIGNEAKKKIKELQAERKNLIAFQSSIVYKSNQEEKKRADERIKAIDEETKRLRQAQKDYNQYGDPDKSKGGRKSEDKDARRLREVVKLYKDAYDWYGKYEKQVGEGSALAKVKEQFEPLFKQFEEQFKQKLSLDSIPLYKENLVSLLNEAQKLYESPKHKNSYMVETIKTIRDAINNVDYEEAQRKMDEYASKVQTELDGLTRAWDMFNNVREATGNIDLAVQLSGADYQAGQTRNLADALREKIEQDFASANAVAIPFDINMSDKDVENNIKAAIPKESEERINGIVEEYKKWRDLQREVFNDSINNYAKILGSLVDHKSQIEKIEDEYKKEVELLDRLRKGVEYTDPVTGEKKTRKITQEQYDEAVGIAKGNADSKEWQASTSYINLMNNSLLMTRSEIEAAANMQRDYLNRELERGAIDAQKYVEEMSKLQNLEKEWSDKGFLGLRGGVGAFLGGGNEGLLNYYQSRGKKARQAYANADYKDSPEAQEKLKEAKHYEGLYKSLAELTDGSKKVFTAFQTLQGGIDLVANLFDSLGMKGASTAMSDVSGVLGSAMSGASSLSALGPWGMAAGAGLGLVSGLFNLHDKALEREISRLREDVQAIEANTDLIVKARERTLGYDTGDLRRSYAQQYAPNETRHQMFLQSNGFLRLFANSRWGQGFDSEAQKAMYEYYQKNSAGTGYQQELANLKAQREDYMKMYDAEQDKKKSSGEALEEYKAKIAELDDQIRHFAEDIAKELWNIDIKAWADQISDAIITAFENGESAVKAFNDAVKSIMQSVASEMLKVGIIEPMMQRLRDKLFGKNGVTSTDKLTSDPMGESRKVLTAIGEYFKPNGEGANLLTAAQEYLYGIDNLMQQMGFANGLRNEDAANTLSSGVQGTSEETSGLLAGYVNALRQDVAINRILFNQFVTELWPTYVEQITAIVSGVGSINQNVSFIRTLLSENGAIYTMLDSMRNHLDNITNGNEQISVK